MQLKIGGKTYTIVYTVEATMCEDLLENVTGMVGNIAGKKGADQNAALLGKMPSLTKSLMYGGLLQMHGPRGDGSVTSKEDAENLLFQYLTENEGKREGKLAYLFNALYSQMGDDNFLSRIGIAEDREEKVTPISKGKK